MGGGALAAKTQRVVQKSKQDRLDPLLDPLLRVAGNIKSIRKSSLRQTQKQYRYDAGKSDQNQKSRTADSCQALAGS